MSNLPTNLLAAQRIPVGTPVRVNGSLERVVGHSIVPADLAYDNVAGTKFDLWVERLDTGSRVCLRVTIAEAQAMVATPNGA